MWLPRSPLKLFALVFLYAVVVRADVFDDLVGHADPQFARRLKPGHLAARLREVEEKRLANELAGAAYVRNPATERATALSDAYRALAPWVESYSDAVEMSDPEFAELAAEEKARAATEFGAHFPALKAALLNHLDPDTGAKGTAVEIVSNGLKADAEAFVRLHSELYLAYGRARSWKAQVLEREPGEREGYKKITIFFRGPGAWEYFRHEAGGHQFKRFPSVYGAKDINPSVEIHVRVERSYRGGELEGELRRDDVKGVPGSRSAWVHPPTGTRADVALYSSVEENEEAAWQLIWTRLLRDARRRNKCAGVLIDGGNISRVRTYDVKAGVISDSDLNFKLPVKETFDPALLAAFLENRADRHLAALVNGVTP